MLKGIAIVIGSVWFLLVSGSACLYAGTIMVAKSDERIMERGDAPHTLFSVVAQSVHDDVPFHVLDRYALDQLETLSLGEKRSGEGGWRTDGTANFLMKAPSGNMDSGDSNYSYQVIEDRGNVQIIEVVQAKHDGDNIIWSRYRATASTVIPISTRMSYLGYMFAAAPYALSTAFVLFVIGRLMRRKLRPA